MEIIYLIIIVIGIICMANIVKSGNDFRDRSQKLYVGMHLNEVNSIMGQPSFVKQHQDGSYEYVYEKSEWKGTFRGGTQTRRMEVVFSSEDIVISIGKNSNCDRSGW